MIAQDQVQNLAAATAYDRSGEKVGRVGAVYFDNETDQPKWVTVNTGLFGTNESFVPVHDAEVSGDRVTVPYDRAQVKDAPNIAADGQLSPEEEQQLYRYYGLGYDDAGDGRGNGRDREVAGGVATDGTTDVAAGHRAADRDTAQTTAGDGMTRSEEQLRVGTRAEQAGRARLRKRVVTEHEQVTVPVSHEEVTLEREPITGDDRGEAHRGSEITEDEHEVTLHAERPVVETETVAKERVRLGKQTVTEQQTVGGEVRKEQIEFDRGDGVRDDTVEDRRDRS